jgi:hypothetical protein
LCLIFVFSDHILFHKNQLSTLTLSHWFILEINFTNYFISPIHHVLKSFANFSIICTCVVCFNRIISCEFDNIEALKNKLCLIFVFSDHILFHRNQLSTLTFSFYILVYAIGLTFNINSLLNLESNSQLMIRLKHTTQVQMILKFYNGFKLWRVNYHSYLTGLF